MNEILSLFQMSSFSPSISTLGTSRPSLLSLLVALNVDQQCMISQVASALMLSSYASQRGWEKGKWDLPLQMPSRLINIRDTPGQNKICLSIPRPAFPMPRQWWDPYNKASLRVCWVSRHLTSRSNLPKGSC